MVRTRKAALHQLAAAAAAAAGGDPELAELQAKLAAMEQLPAAMTENESLQFLTASPGNADERCAAPLQQPQQRGRSSMAMCGGRAAGEAAAIVATRRVVINYRGWQRHSPLTTNLQLQTV